METQTDTPPVQLLAQQLVTLKHEITQLEAQSTDIKRSLIQLMPQGTVQCNGGKVTVFEEQQVLQQDTETLIQLLFERANFSRTDAEALVRDGKISRPKDGYVSVRLDANGA